jgi:hypothetical protein
MHVAVIDVGSHGKNLGWWIAGPCRGEGNNDIDCCVDVLAAALREGPLALVFEAPLFVPQRNKPSELLKARRGECIGGVNRPFSAGAGAAVLAAALVVVPYVLSKLNTAVPHAMTVLDWRSKLSRPGQIFFFEAFVTNQGSSRPDTRNVEDARRAVDAFQRGMLRPEEFNSAIDEPNCFNFLGAMLL